MAQNDQPRRLLPVDRSQIFLQPIDLLVQQAERSTELRASLVGSNEAMAQVGLGVDVDKMGHAIVVRVPVPTVSIQCPKPIWWSTYQKFSRPPEGPLGILKRLRYPVKLVWPTGQMASVYAVLLKVAFPLSQLASWLPGLTIYAL